MHSPNSMYRAIYTEIITHTRFRRAMCYYYYYYYYYDYYYYYYYY